MADHDGHVGARCSECGVWRWLPMGFTLVPPLSDQVLPPLLEVPGLADVDVAASPEWFGDGWKSFRQVVVRRALAELIVDASPRDFLSARSADRCWFAWYRQCGLSAD